MLINRDDIVLIVFRIMCRIGSILSDQYSWWISFWFTCIRTSSIKNDFYVTMDSWPCMYCLPWKALNDKIWRHLSDKIYLHQMPIQLWNILWMKITAQVMRSSMTRIMTCGAECKGFKALPSPQNILSFLLVGFVILESWYKVTCIQIDIWYFEGLM